MTVIIGIDPGSRRTGFGVIAENKGRLLYMASGYLDLTAYPKTERPRQIYLGLQNIIQEFHPEEAAIEQIFLHENPNTALKLGQARGAAMVALNMPVQEYAARQVKKSVAGRGNADKTQVQYMVLQLLKLKGELQQDAGDALAVALCHAYSRSKRGILS